jgi:hypothetical protein
VTFAGRFFVFGVFFVDAGEAAAVGVVTGVVAAAAVAELDAGLETLTSAGLGDCFEHALTTSNSPRIAKPAIIASFCWRDQDESVVPEIVLLVAWLVDLWLVDFWSVDFQIVAIFVTSSAAGAVGSDMARERPTRRLLMWRDLWANLAWERVHRHTRRVTGNTLPVACGASR